MALKKLLGEILAELGFITHSQLKHALDRQRNLVDRGSPPEHLQRSRLVAESRRTAAARNIPLLGEVLKNMGFVTQDQLETALKSQHDMLQEYCRIESDALCNVMDIGIMVNSSLNLAEVLDRILSNANQVTDSVASTLMLLEEKTDDLVFSVPTGPKAEQITDIRIKRGQGIAGWVAENEQAVIIPDVAEDPRFYDGVDQLSGFKTKTILAVPLKTKGKLIGVLEAINKQDGTSFTEKDALLLTIFGSQAAMAIENARLYGELRDHFEEKRRMERSFAKSEKLRALGQLSGGIAHDFNNILSAIIGYTEIALYSADDPAKGRKCMEQVLAASERARDLVGQILAFSRKSVPEKIPVQIDPIIREAVQLLRSTLPSSIEIETDIHPGTAAVSADPSQIHQVLINLITNAFHACGDQGGTIRVSLTPKEIAADPAVNRDALPPGAYVELAVADDGCGMEDCLVDQIFEPYFTTKEKGVGTGMGLAVVQGIVKNHGGVIRVHSRPGKGTRFQLLFPRVAKEAAPKMAADSRLPTGSERILLVDDEEPLIEIGTQILTTLGYRVTARTHPEKAMALFRKDPGAFDLVLTDMTMPKLSGSEMALQMLELRPDLPVILITGYNERINREKALSLGIRELVYKPLNTAALSALLRTTLDQAPESPPPE